MTSTPPAIDHTPTAEAIDRARAIIANYLQPTPLRHYPRLDAWVGNDVEVWVKHEDHQPTGAFKVRNGLVAVSLLPAKRRKRGIIGATRGNHGQGLAFAGKVLGAPVVICVPHGNSPSKNQAMIDLGAELLIDGKDYDESVAICMDLVNQRGLTLVHSTNDDGVLAGAATITAEILDQAPADLSAIFVAVGGGSQASGAIAAVQARGAAIDIYAVQANHANAAALSWHSGKQQSIEHANTFAGGLATRAAYDYTFPILQSGLRDFITVSDDDLAAAIRSYVDHTQTIAEGAGAASLAGLKQISKQLEGRKVAIVLSGRNLDGDVLRTILNGNTPSL